MKLTLPWPDKALSANARVHWRVKAKKTRAARWAAWGAAQAEGLRNSYPYATLRFTYHPPDRRLRDAQNIPHMLKPTIDGIADAMGCDDSRFECVFPSRFSDPVRDGSIIAEIGVTVEGQFVPLRGVVS